MCSVIFLVGYKSEFLVDIFEINIATGALAFWFKNLTTLEENEPFQKATGFKE